MFLSRLTPDRRSPDVIADLADIVALHRTVMRAFGSAPDRTAARRHFGVLLRVEDPAGDVPLVVLVSSRAEPDWSLLPAGYLARPAETRPMGPMLAALRPGVSLRFRLIARPYRYEAREGFRLDGRPARARKVALDAESERATWLRERLTTAGAELVRHDQVRLADISGRRAMEGVTYRPTRFEGVFVVRDPDALRTALAEGIGPGKAYGLGLLSVAAA